MIGIFGGSFDPVHQGHLHIANAVVNRLSLQQLQFVPCALPVHRERPQASPMQRCAMLEQVIRERPEFSLNRLEIERSGPSYTVDSLRQIREDYDSGLLLLLGADAFNGFTHWKQPMQILKLAHLVVCLRPGSDVDAAVFPDRRVELPTLLDETDTGKILMLEVDAPDCSSSAVRAALAANQSLIGLLPPSVEQYIEHHHLYRRSGD